MPLTALGMGLIALSIIPAQAQDLTQLPTQPGLTFYDDIAVVTSPESLLTSTPDGAVRTKLERWEDGILPIEFDEQVTLEQRKVFLQACQVWEKLANIQCIEKPYKNRTLKVGALTTGCWGLYGMGSLFPGLRRRINLSSDCWDSPTVIHEIGHALGLIHEHQRQDRDSYITIHPENIDEEFLFLTQKLNFGPQSMGFNTPYDFLSIMHYGRNSFSKNGRDTIVPKPEYAEFINVMGNVSLPSAQDAQTVVSIYGPPKN